MIRYTNIQKTILIETMSSGISSYQLEELLNKDESEPVSLTAKKKKILEKEKRRKEFEAQKESFIKKKTGRTQDKAISIKEYHSILSEMDEMGFRGEEVREIMKKNRCIDVYIEARCSDSLLNNISKDQKIIAITSLYSALRFNMENLNSDNTLLEDVVMMGLASKDYLNKRMKINNERSYRRNTKYDERADSHIMKLSDRGINNQVIMGLELYYSDNKDVNKKKLNGTIRQRYALFGMSSDYLNFYNYLLSDQPHTKEQKEKLFDECLNKTICNYRGYPTEISAFLYLKGEDYRRGFIRRAKEANKRRRNRMVDRPSY